jgi:hypothetical protein
MDRLVAGFKKGEVKLSELVAHHQSMKAYYLEINYVLTSYDRQYYKEALEKINENIFELRKKAEPKKKFKFSRRDGDFGVKEQAQAEEAKKEERKETTIPGVEGRHSEKIIITKECPEGGSFKIVSCDNIEVDLL